MRNSVDAHGRHGRARDGRQQRPAQGVAERVSETGLEGLDDESRAAVLLDDLLGERGSLCNEHWVSFRRGARYMTPFLMVRLPSGRDPGGGRPIPAG